jgi:hypothetical protein
MSWGLSIIGDCPNASTSKPLASDEDSSVEVSALAVAIAINHSMNNNSDSKDSGDMQTPPKSNVVSSTMLLSIRSSKRCISASDSFSKKKGESVNNVDELLSTTYLGGDGSRKKKKVSNAKQPGKSTQK